MTNERTPLKVVQSDCCVIMVVDDDAAMRGLLVDELSEVGCGVVQASDGQEAFSQLKVSRPNLVITDLNMKFGGLAFIKCLQRAIPKCPIIVLTAFGDAQTKSLTKIIGVAGYFDKPVRMADLRSLVTQVCPYSQCQHTQGRNP